MTPRTRSQDLAADLLRDLESAQEVESPRASTSPVDPEPAPFVEGGLYLSPRAWKLPGVVRAGRSISVSAGPVRLRVGRPSGTR